MLCMYAVYVSIGRNKRFIYNGNCYVTGVDNAVGGSEKVALPTCRLKIAAKLLTHCLKANIT